MINQELYDRIDPSLRFVEILARNRPWVHLVEKEGTNYVLKLGSSNSYLTEKDALERACNVVGITHLVRDYGLQDDDIGVLLKEFAPGVGFDRIRLFMDKRRKKAIREQVTGTLEQLHQLGICSVDLKAKHIIVDPTDNAKLIDFDCVSIYDPTHIEYKDTNLEVGKEVDLRDLSRIFS